MDASKSGSYTAVITYGENKSVSYPVDVVDDYVTSWPGFNNSYQTGTKLSDIIGEVYPLRLAKEGIVNPTSDMVTGWDSSVRAKRHEFKYKEFSREYKNKIYEEVNNRGKSLRFLSQRRTFTNVSYFMFKGQRVKKAGY